MPGSYDGRVTTPPQDPFGTPREGDGAPAGRPSWDTPGTYGTQPGSGQQPGPQYDRPQYDQPQYDQPQPGGQFGQQYQQQYPQQYGAPPPGYGTPQAWHGPTSTESKAIIALVCAIASWVVLPVLPAIAALMIGKTARTEIAASGGRLTGDGLVTAAKVIAWTNIVVTVLAVVFIVLAVVLFAASGAALSVA